MKQLRARLEQQRDRGLYRVREVLEGPQGPEITLDGHRYLAFCSNDYLGLAGHPELIRAWQRGAETYGVGSGASHLIVGHSRAHHELEEALAEFTGRPRALLFSTGYMANLGALGALAGRGDRVFADRLDHASLLDAGLLSGARMRRYPHGDVARLERWLGRAPQGAGRFVITDGVFSMDGDLAPLPRLAATARRGDARLMVDDAHGLGVIGPGGRGTAAHYAVGTAEVPVLVGTLGKAFGSFGAFVAGEDDLIETLIQFARTYTYTTALPPASACATLAALRLSDKEPWRRERLHALVDRFHAGATQLGLPVQRTRDDTGTAVPTPIIPLVVGDADRALRLAEALRARGLLVSAIRPPTVPRGGARLRLTFSADHTEAQVDRLLDTLEAVV